jgi:hypothetical protein
MDRSNHYEAAFEEYLKWHRLPYVAVDESRRTMLGDAPVKSLDFIVYGPEGARLLLDVKGRRFPSGPADKPRRVWECWSTEDDVDGLEQWTALFGAGYQGLLVFMYQLAPGEALPEAAADLWTWNGQRYLLRAVAVEDYRVHLRVRSPSWKTVSLPGPVFRELAKPFYSYVMKTQFTTENTETTERDFY